MTLFCNLPFSGPLQLISATRLKILIYLLQIKIKRSLIIDCVHIDHVTLVSLRTIDPAAVTHHILYVSYLVLIVSWGTPTWSRRGYSRSVRRSGGRGCSLRWAG